MRTVHIYMGARGTCAVVVSGDSADLISEVRTYYDRINKRDFATAHWNYRKMQILYVADLLLDEELTRGGR